MEKNSSADTIPQSSTWRQLKCAPIQLVKRLMLSLKWKRLSLQELSNSDEISARDHNLDEKTIQFLIHKPKLLWGQKIFLSFHSKTILLQPNVPNRTFLAFEPNHRDPLNYIFTLGNYSSWLACAA